MTDTALLALDLQRDFLSPGGKLPIETREIEPLIGAANRSLAAAAMRGWKTVIITNQFRRTDWLRNLLRKGAAIDGSAGAELDERISIPTGALRLSKTSSDAFSNPRLPAFLAAESIRRVVLLGVMAEGCVLATAKGALKSGVRVTVLKDAVGSSHPFLLRLALARMRWLGIEQAISNQI